MEKTSAKATGPSIGQSGEQTATKPLYAAVPQGLTTEVVFDAFSKQKEIYIQELALDGTFLTVLPRTEEDRVKLLQLSSLKILNYNISLSDDINAAKAAQGSVFISATKSCKGWTSNKNCTQLNGASKKLL
jgi:hypothetical protein